MRRESLAKKLVNKDPKVFWKEIKLMNASKTPISSCIDGVSGVCNIAELWRTHYSKLFNSIPSISNDKYSIDKVTDITDLFVSTHEVEQAIKELDCNKACGSDGIYMLNILNILIKNYVAYSVYE